MQTTVNYASTLGMQLSSFGISRKHRDSVDGATTRLLKIPIMLFLIVTFLLIFNFFSGEEVEVLIINSIFTFALLLSIFAVFYLKLRAERIHEMSKIEIYELGFVLMQKGFFWRKKIETCRWNEIVEITESKALGELLGLNILKRSGEKVFLQNKFQNFESIVEILNERKSSFV